MKVPPQQPEAEEIPIHVFLSHNNYTSEFLLSKSHYICTDNLLCTAHGTVELNNMSTLQYT